MPLRLVLVICAIEAEALEAREICALEACA